MTQGTFRDPAGSLRLEGGQALRSIHPTARAATLAFLDSPFCRAAQQRGDLIAAEIDDSPAGLTLRHPRISFPTYPWEWTPSQWFAAAELTLNLCEEALVSGLILKDATPLNVLFTGARPVFVDILSFEPRDPAATLWLAYGQYVRTFLLPLVMRRQLCWPLSLSLYHRDGYEPAACYAALNLRQRLSRSALWPITLPTLLDRRKSPQTAPTHRRPHSQDPEVSFRVLRRTLNDLRGRTRRAAQESSASNWSGYTNSLTHYTPQQSQAKLDWVRHALQSIAPSSVLDIGANTGDFSVLAAETLGRPGAQSESQIVALERDLAA
ncbi:MAG TPA: methyltransferase type 12, partial [Acidobacteriaceae bacterium]